MCLSSVYEVKNGSQRLVGEQISGVRTDSGGVVLTDIMGDETVVRGALRSIDLVKNVILIDAAP